MNEHAARKPIKLFYFHMFLYRSVKCLQTAKLMKWGEKTILTNIFFKDVDLVFGLFLLSHIGPPLLYCASETGYRLHKIYRHNF